MHAQEGSLATQTSFSKTAQKGTSGGGGSSTPAASSQQGAAQPNGLHSMATQYESGSENPSSRTLAARPRSNAALTSSQSSPEWDSRCALVHSMLATEPLAAAMPYVLVQDQSAACQAWELFSCHLRACLVACLSIYLPAPLLGRQLIRAGSDSQCTCQHSGDVRCCMGTRYILCQHCTQLGRRPISTMVTLSCGLGIWLLKRQGHDASAWHAGMRRESHPGSPRRNH